MQDVPKFTRRSFLKAGAAAATLAAAGLPAAAAAPEQENGLFSRVTPQVQTQYGPVLGQQEQGCLAFYSIPYGEAPGGEGRWQAPLDPVPWAAVRDCTCPGPEASQYRCGLSGVEDCLRLDVYTAARARRWPVLVFLHSGGNQTGSAQELRGHRLVERAECVVVSVDYRLGLLGFNCLPALCAGADATGNFALLDIAKALDWVRENIAAFGGDPDDLTLAGFEAGGRDVLAMLASPLGQGRFQRAVCLSGGMTTAQPQPSAQKIAAAFAPLAVQDGLFASEAEAAAWLLTPEPEVRRWLCGLDVARLAPVMSNANDRMGAFPHLYADGVSLPEQGFAAPLANPVPLMLVTGCTEFSLTALWAAAPAALPAQPAVAPAGEQAIQFAVRYGSELERIFHTQHTAQVLADTGCTAPVYLCQVNYGAPDSRRPIPSVGSFLGVAIPMLTDDHSYNLLHDFSAQGYQQMADRFCGYLSRFMRGGDPVRGGRLDQPAWPGWTPQQPLSLVLDASDTESFAQVQDVSGDTDQLCRQMQQDPLDRDSKKYILEQILAGRFFSQPLEGLEL